MIRWIALVVAAALILFGLCFFGIWIPNEPARAKYPIRGIDVSHHQRDINWDAVKGAGISFSYIKATEGADFKDKRFQANWAEADAAMKTIGGTCGSCHTAHRGEKTPDGRYSIKK